MLFLGIDIGSSSVKLSVLDGAKGQTIASCQHPKSELAIQSPQAGFAEQDPAVWWECVVEGLKALKETVDLSAIRGIGIAYQMHGLVVVDDNQQVLRPAIIWCDSRAVPYGEKALEELGEDACYTTLLNSPGNFTAAKLRWVQQNEPELFKRIRHIMLPGDYIAMRLSGEVTTTASGLSEGTLWNFERADVAEELLEHWGMDRGLIPALTPTLGAQSQVSTEMAELLGLTARTPITYRAGDQPNNAFSLNVLQPGEVAATAGTSGVVYAVTDLAVADRDDRVNTFLHVSNTETSPRNGVLACVNGTGRAYSWLSQQLAQAGGGPGYPALNNLALATPVGAEGLSLLPFGNGAERLLQNRNPGAQFCHLDFNRHNLGHLVRATQEGIAFALYMGVDVLHSLGVKCNKIRAGKSNMFLSPLFVEAFANISGATIELYNTDGAEGAARAAALGANFYKTADEAFIDLRVLETVAPQALLREQYLGAYDRWQNALAQQLNTPR